MSDLDCLHFNCTYAPGQNFETAYGSFNISDNFSELTNFTLSFDFKANSSTFETLRNSTTGELGSNAEIFRIDYINGRFL